MPELLDRLKQALADRYAIERELGASGMAAVCLAEDLKHHRQVFLSLRNALAEIALPWSLCGACVGEPVGPRVALVVITPASLTRSPRRGW